MYLICPICKSQLILSDKSYRCENNHSYDLAKEGYIHLLPVQKKNSKNPGDNKEMIAARRSFLESGHYTPLVDQIIATVDPKKKTTLLDAGCGEGYYSAQVKRKFNDITILGFDISKEAIKKAAKKYKDQFFFIAGVTEIPIADKTIDTYLTIFAPIDTLEINRILAEDGQVIIVSAGPNHMREIAENIYESYIPHDYDPCPVLSSHFELKTKQDISFTIQLEQEEDIKKMLQMTPYYWSANKETLEAILSQSVSVTCEFQIHVFLRK